MSIAQRRHHRERLQHNRRRHWGRDLINEPKCLSMAVDTPHPCSCPACGNQRKTEGKTIQERKSIEAKGL